MQRRSNPNIVPAGRVDNAMSMPPSERPLAKGKFVFVGDCKVYVKAVTYGTFQPDGQGEEFYDRRKIEDDFMAMAAVGINAIRTYTVPPRWMLDLARNHGLLVMVGLPWEQHITFLDDARRMRSIEQRIRAGVRQCAGHPAVLCYAVGNEIPAAIVRWAAPRRTEAFIRRLFLAAKKEDPKGLVTYVNYPSTEYLQLPFLDLFCYNVYLEKKVPFEAYTARLQNIAGDRPLLLAELGLDSRRNGETRQTEALDWQIRSAFAGGCAGVFIFSWTDEWHRAGQEIKDWDFGLTRRDRSPKPALGAVNKAFGEAPLLNLGEWPRVSVVVCTFNGERTLQGTCQALHALEYPNYEVIVVDDGSLDQSPYIAEAHGYRTIRTGNRGLSSARNTGWKAAKGEIVAYLDDDAFPDQHWLNYLVHSFNTTKHAAVGGPNIAPPDSRLIAGCVARSPGGPLHVLLDDRQAEHIPGCNMAFRRSCLEELGGFDPTFRIAGDDVDICWRILARGWSIGFHPTAMVWHQRRGSIRDYWRQQKGYGRAEGMLERKWPGRYNAAGHVTWRGRVYDKGISGHFLQRRQIYLGFWGSAPFQRLYQPATNTPASIAATPEWWLIILVLIFLSGLGLLWHPFLLVVPAAVAAVSIVLLQVVLSARRATLADYPVRERQRLQRFLVTVWLHVLQPLARLLGRLQQNLTPWRWHFPAKRSGTLARQISIWSEEWREPSAQLQAVTDSLRKMRCPVLLGNNWERWDLEVAGGFCAAARLLMSVEEHGQGRQNYKFRISLRFRIIPLSALIMFAVLTFVAGLDDAPAASFILGALALLLGYRISLETRGAAAALHNAIQTLAGSRRTSLDEVPKKPQFSN